MSEAAPPGPEPVAVLLPVKAFHLAKVRLAPRLDATERATLARAMATKVLRAAGTLPVFVVCDDDDVASWAGAEGAEVSWQPGRGLNEAVSAAVTDLQAQGFSRALVVHADIPRAHDLARLAPEASGLLLVPDRHQDGTNLIGLPTSAPFRFAYGPGSFERHRAEATRLGLSLRIVADDDLGWDVDVPSDLSALEGLALD